MGTRAEGAPAGCPFTLVLQLRSGLPFQKGAPFKATRLFGSKILMHYIIDEIRIIWVPLQLRLRGAGADNIANVRYTLMYRPNGRILQKKKKKKNLLTWVPF